MEISKKQLKYRGKLTALVSTGSTLTFCTTHDEGLETALYRIDVDALTLAESPLKGGCALAVGAKSALVAAATGTQLLELASGALSAHGAAVDEAPSALAALSNDRFAIATGKTVRIVDGTKKAKELQSFTLPDAIKVLAATPAGDWFVAGDEAGTVTVFTCEEADDYSLSEQSKLHDGAITALAFDPDELRFASAGSDGRLLLTHARGALEPEDRGGRNGHDSPITCILFGTEDRFYTGAGDGTLKAWIGSGKGRPSSISAGVGSSVALALVERGGQPHIAQACSDHSLRLFALEEEGKLGARKLLIEDGYNWADAELAATEPQRREAALRFLASYNDEASISTLAQRASDDADHALKVLAVKLLAETGNPRTGPHLEALLEAPEEALRLAALDGLRALEGKESLRPLRVALDLGTEELGLVVIAALAELSARDDQALTLLEETLDNEPRPVRFAALEALTKVLGPGPEPELRALGASQADVRWRALVNAYERKLLDEPRIQAALRRHGEDKHADVRHVAFLISLTRAPRLVEALRGRDANLHRALHELETGASAPPGGHTAATSTAGAGKKAAKKKGRKGADEVDESAAAPAELPAAKKVKLDILESSDLIPLLEAMASRAQDTCLNGAACLATVEDHRAFGTLLQLSRVDDAQTRVKACNALEVLGDTRALQRLRIMLRDGDEQVRDAAFSALSKLLTDEPLEAASAGLMAEHVDVRKRGLRILTRVLRAAIKKDGVAKVGPDHEARTLLARALNDGAKELRSEAFKSALSLGVGALEEGDTANVLRFTCGSIHGDLRHDALLEVMGQIAEPWAWPLLLELFNDPDSAVRGEAFKFAQKRAKGKALEPLAAALTSKYPELRQEATIALTKRREDGAQLLLIRALADSDNTVRQLAVDALVVAGFEPALETAMSSQYSNVRVRAASALAELGRASAKAPLLAEIAVPRPTFDDERALWSQYLQLALQGLANLGDPDTAKAIVELLTFDEAPIRAAASNALAYCAHAGNLDLLRAALQHSDNNVCYNAAAGLAFCGDPVGLSVIFVNAEKSRGRKTRLSQKELPPDLTFYALLVSLALGKQGEDAFLSFLDHPDADLHTHALLMALMLDLASDRSDPRRCLAAMASAHPAVRLRAAWALDLWSRPEEFDAYVLSLVNDRGDHSKPGLMTAPQLRTLAAMVAYGQSHVRARFAGLLWYLTESDDEDGLLLRKLETLTKRYKAEVDTATKAIPAPKKLDDATVRELRELVVGAYIGLSRQMGYRTEALRQTALARLLALVGSISLGKKPSAEEQRAAADLLGSATAAFLQALRDNNQAVRAAAFECLTTLKVDVAMLSTEALGTGYRDVGAQGLRILTEGSDKKTTVKVLEGVMSGHTDGLEYEACRLLIEAVGEAPALTTASEAKSEQLRLFAVEQLAQRYEDKDCKKALYGTLKSRYQAVRFRAANGLANKKDLAALDVLKEQLKRDNSAEQRRASQLLTTIGAPECARALLDRVTNDPAGTAAASILLNAVGDFRLPQMVDPLLALFDNLKLRDFAFYGALKSCGHDQRVLEGDDDTSKARLAQLKREYPRDDASLARIMDTLYRKGDSTLIRRVIPQARWAQSKATEAILQTLLAHRDDTVRDLAVEAYGWRARWRKTDPTPLVAALSTANPNTQFLAAEGLARVGRKEGLNILLTSVEMMDDLNLRNRAVEALGFLADERALDVLLRFASDPEHALHESAIEAIGHLSKSPKAKEIFRLLKKALEEGDSAERAIHGLRWFGGAEAWALIRGQVEHDYWRVRQEAAEVLGYDLDAASREALIKLIREDGDSDVAEAAVKSLRKHLGEDSIEVDFIVVTSPGEDLEEGTIQRLSEKGDAARLLEVLSKLHEDTAYLYEPALVEALLARDPLPVEAAATALNSVHDVSARVAAQIIGRAGEPAAKKHGKALVAATTAARERWWEAHNHKRTDDRDSITPRWHRALWACGRLGVGAEEVLQAAAIPTTIRPGKDLKLEALTVLASGLAKKPGIDLLAAEATSADAAVRLTAASSLRKVDPKRAAELVETSLDDASTLHQLFDATDKGAAKSLRAASSSAHYQGVALPHLIHLADVEGLSKAATDGKLSREAREGAIEGLARIASKDVEKAILAVATSESEEEELRKAAWRALRRARRARV